MKKEIDNKEHILEVAEQVKLLFGFCAQLIPDKEMIKQTAQMAEERHSGSMAMAPVIGAFGGSWEDAEFDTKLHARRADALYNLINVLDETEKDRAEHETKKVKRSEGLVQIHRALGL